MVKFPSSNHSMTLPPGMFTTAWKVISHVSMSFPEYVHLIFWEEQAVISKLAAISKDHIVMGVGGDGNVMAWRWGVE